MPLGNCDLLSRLFITYIVAARMTRTFGEFRSGTQGRERREEAQYYPSQ